MTNYFAYGSNLDSAQMVKRCPNAIVKTAGFINNYKLDFTIYSPKRNCGCADIVANTGDKVWGVIYELTEEDLASLDRAENHPISYHRISVNIVDESGTNIPCETYEVVNKSVEFLPPSRDYLNQIINGAKKYQLPLDYIEKLQVIDTLD